MQRDGNIAPFRRHEVVAKARFRRETDRVQNAIDTSPLRIERGTHVVEMLRHGDIEFVHLDRIRKLAGDTLGQAQSPTGAGQHDARPFFLRKLGHPESQRCVGEDAGDHNVLAVEQTHVSDRSHVGSLT